MRLRRIALMSAATVAVVAVACFSNPQYPGDQVLGTFRFDAAIDWSKTSCTMADGGIVQIGDAGTLRFEGTFSRQLDGGDAGYLTVQGFSRKASFEGQRAISVQRVAAKLAGCGSTCEGAQIEETLDTVLLSSSQDEVLGRKCSGLGDGGIPESDGGVQPPGPTPNGYDVQRACGSLTDDFIPGTKNCTCTTGCRAVYTVEGTRVN